MLWALRTYPLGRWWNAQHTAVCLSTAANCLQVEVLAAYELRPDEAAAQGGRKSVAVAVRQGPLLATAFHPELTTDLRWCGVVWWGGGWGRAG